MKLTFSDNTFNQCTFNIYESYRKEVEQMMEQQVNNKEIYNLLKDIKKALETEKKENVIHIVKRYGKDFVMSCLANIASNSLMQFLLS